MSLMSRGCPKFTQTLHSRTVLFSWQRLAARVFASVLSFLNFLFLQGSSGLPGELCQQSAFRFLARIECLLLSTLSSAKNSLDNVRLCQKIQWTLSDCGLRRQWWWVSGHPGSQFSFSICIAFFFLKPLRIPNFLMAVETSFGLRTPAFLHNR